MAAQPPPRRAALLRGHVDLKRRLSPVKNAPRCIDRDCYTLTMLTDIAQPPFVSSAWRKIPAASDFLAVTRVAENSPNRRRLGTADVNSPSNCARWCSGCQSGLAFATSPTPSPKARLIPSEAENPRCKTARVFCPNGFQLVGFQAVLAKSLEPVSILVHLNFGCRIPTKNRNKQHGGYS